MKNAISAIALLCAMSISIISCDKETTTLLNTAANSTPTFSSEEALKTALKRVETMGEEERRAYEAEQGYKSLLTKSYELYEQIDPATLTDVEQLYQHVAKHPDWLEITKDAQGELEYNPIYADNSYSLLAGADRMLVLGESCLKVFKDGIITAPLEELEALQSSQGQSVKDIAENKAYSTTMFESSAFIQKTNCGRDREDTETNGNNRTKLSLECYLKAISSSLPIPVGEAQGRIIPQKRTLGVWFRARRTITGRFQFDFAYDQDGTSISGVVGSGATIEFPINDVLGSTLAYSVTRTYSFPLGGFFPFEYQFSFINSFGDTPSTGNATIVCH